MTDAWRLTFAYDGDDFSLKSIRRLTKRVPPGQPVATQSRGMCVELRDGQGRVLYRRSIAQLLPTTMEYPTGYPKRPLGRVNAPGAGEVALLVPADPKGRLVAVVGRGPGRLGAAGTAKLSDEASGPRDLISVELPPSEGEEGGQ